MQNKPKERLQNSSLEKANSVFRKQLHEDHELLKLAEQAKTDATVKLSTKELRDRVQNNAK